MDLKKINLKLLIMKKSIILFAFLIFNFAIANNFKIIESDPLFEGVDCARTALILYDNDIHQEVDVETAFERALEFLEFCEESQQ